MRHSDDTSYLRFYFITDDQNTAMPAEKQVETALSAGATLVQYRNKRFAAPDFEQVVHLRRLCAANGVPFIINDDIVLARAVDADGVHLGQTDASAALARSVLGDGAIIGISASTPEELSKTDFSACDYIGSGPVYATGTKADAGPVIGLAGLSEMAARSSRPVVAIGGIGPENAGACLDAGAAGVAVISSITRSSDPDAAAGSLARICGCVPRKLQMPWADEFLLIDQLVGGCASAADPHPGVRVAAGDDAALLERLERPVITTDAQREGVHFRIRWQSMAEIGAKAVEITFSDLAASYAKPVALFVNLTLPETFTEAEGLKLYAGIDAALTRHGAALAGGNISSGRELALDLFAIGEGGQHFPRRNAARAGDGLYVSGPLGLARAGLNCLRKGDTAFPELIARFKSPTARFDAAGILAECGVICVLDISDGLAGDAAHIAAASNLSIRFDPERFFIAPELAAYCSKYGLDPAGEILSGGEDYELLFACPPPTFEQVRSRLPAARQVGHCLPYAGKRLLSMPEGVFSYRHGKKQEVLKGKK